jgi:hypothetical protein
LDCWRGLISSLNSLHEFRSPAAQDDIGAAQAPLQFRQRQLDISALVIEHRQFLDAFVRIEVGGKIPVR